MTTVKHPTFKNVVLEIQDSELAAHVAAGWTEVQPKAKPKGKATKKDTSPATDEA